MKKSFFRTLIILLIIITIPFPAYADYGPIQIDSYYDDWEDKPHTEVYPGKNPPEKKINYVSLFRDESNVYVHVIFAQSNNQGITNMTIDLRTNLGDEDYFIVPDLFQWDEEMDSVDSSESATEQNRNENPETIPDEGADVTELPDLDVDSETVPAADSENDTVPAEDDVDDVDAAPAENNGPDTPEQDPGSNPGSEEQNLLSGRLRGDIFIVADNETNAESPVDESPAAVEESEPEPEVSADPEEPADPAADNDQREEPEPDATDESADPGSEPTAGETGGEDQGDLLDLFDPEYNIDPGNILNQLSPDTAEEMEPEEEDLNGNMNLNKPGFYGTWAFSVWNGLRQVGTGYYTRSEGEPDELELYIPLSSITDEHDGITEISMVIKKLGKQEIFSVGASTGPFIGIVAGAGIAMLSVGAYTYRKKRPFLHSEKR